MKSGLTSWSGPSQCTAWGRPRAASNHWFSLQPWPCRPPDGFSSAYRPKASGAGWGLLGLEETRVQQWDGGPQGRGRLRAGRGSASLRVCSHHLHPHTAGQGPRGVLGHLVSRSVQGSCESCGSLLRTMGKMLHFGQCCKVFHLETRA